MSEKTKAGVAMYSVIAGLSGLVFIFDRWNLNILADVFSVFAVVVCILLWIANTIAEIK